MTEVARAILELARWAPSGDNTQPWRFEIRSPEHIVVHGFDTREHCVYDLDGHSSQLAIGGLLESIRIAATHHGLRTRILRRLSAPEERPVFDVRLEPDAAVRPDPLAQFLTLRTVQRRAMRTRPLTLAEKAALERSIGEGYEVHWFEGWTKRWQMARLLWLNAGLRLTLPEAYAVHRSIIEWGAHYSEDRIPEKALGVTPLTARVMRYAMQSWQRVEFFNRWLGGTWGPRLELDVVPALACAAHFVICAPAPLRGIDDYIDGGVAMPRFWLAACSLGLQVQPEMTPLIFARYAARERRFSRLPGARKAAEHIGHELGQLFGKESAACAVFMGRIGAGPAAKARSLRLPLERLLLDGREP